MMAMVAIGCLLDVPDYLHEAVSGEHAQRDAATGGAGQQQAFD